jgi:3-hydroxybutyryl-CoA dehydrogenase
MEERKKIQITVVGAGTMGNGIAHLFAAFGYPVQLTDISREALDRGLAAISRNMERQVVKGTLTAERRVEALANIVTGTDLKEACRDAGLVIEAIAEDERLKSELFSRLDGFVPAACILASNTSSISITRLAAATSRPGRVIGMHFMNPVPVMKLVEVINGYSTHPDTTRFITEMASRLDKTACVANDYPGFIANRILMPMINEAITALFEGVAGVKEIDDIMKLGMAHPMGPLQLADFIGLDVCLSIMKVLYEGFGQARYAPCPLLVNMVAAGSLGLKAGQGFYIYTGGTKELIPAPRFKS